MAVTKQAIVDASIEILNQSGIENLSMRTIANALDVKAAALYNHISGKQALLSMIAEHLCMRIDMPDSTMAPLAYLTAVHAAYRQALLSVRDSASVFENSLPNTKKRMEIIRCVGQKLIALGVSPENLMTVSNMLNNYVLSFAADEARKKSADAFIDALPPDERAMYISPRDYDAQFAYGLQVLFTGIREVN